MRLFKVFVLHETTEFNSRNMIYSQYFYDIINYTTYNLALINIRNADGLNLCLKNVEITWRIFYYGLVISDYYFIEYFYWNSDQTICSRNGKTIYYLFDFVLIFN